jgi:hypothetical protein
MQRMAMRAVSIRPTWCTERKCWHGSGSVLACALPHATLLCCAVLACPAASLKKMMPNKCTVCRDGQEKKVEAHELVPGDLVRLCLGDRVPADIRIIETADLKVAGRTGCRAGWQRAGCSQTPSQQLCTRCSVLGTTCSVHGIAGGQH